MKFLVLIINALIAVGVISIVASDNRKGKVPLFSCRNVFLAGFLFFQNFGLNAWLLNRFGDAFWAYRVRDVDSMTSLKYVALQFICLLFIFGAYKFFNPRFRKSQRIDSQKISQQSLVLQSLALSLLATLVWGAGFIALKDLCVFISSGVGATATGVATYAWLRDRENPLLLALLVFVGAASCLPHLTEYGRRGLVSLAMIVAWVGHLKVMVRVNVPKLTMAILLFTSPMLVLLAAFSQARVRNPKSVSQAVKYMMEADIVHGLRRLANFQGSSTISMWCMEKYPERFEYRHLYSARATVHFFVPREFWPDKPIGLGIQIPKQARLRNVGGLNVGAGLIGHAMCEGGLYALIIYSILIGYGLKWMDNYVFSRSHLIYTLPMLSGLGQLFATPRGEVNFFIDAMLIGIVTSMLAMKAVNYLIPLSTDPESESEYLEDRVPPDSIRGIGFSEFSDP